MNILIIGYPNNNIVNLIKSSKYADKVYTAINGYDGEFPNIEYRTFEELIQKALALKIDIAINTDKILIMDGIAEAFKSSKINLISVNKKWFNLESSRLSAKKLLDHYKLNTPQIVRVPLEFPIVIKTDLPDIEYIANSIQDVVSKMEELEGQTTFFEEYVTGKNFELYAIWDKNNIKYFYSNESLTEVQNDRLDLLKTKLNFMFSDEKADFVGIFSVHLVWYKNDWFVREFDMGATIPPDCIKKTDFIFLLNSAIYQKLE